MPRRAVLIATSPRAIVQHATQWFTALLSIMSLLVLSTALTAKHLRPMVSSETADTLPGFIVSTFVYLIFGLVLCGKCTPHGMIYISHTFIPVGTFPYRGFLRFDHLFHTLLPRRYHRFHSSHIRLDRLRRDVTDDLVTIFVRGARDTSVPMCESFASIKG